MDEIIWMSLADDSWGGGCDLILVDTADFTDEELDALDDAQTNSEACNIIRTVYARTKRTRI